MVENNNGWTVLHTAVNTDKCEITEMLLNHPKVRPPPLPPHYRACAYCVHVRVHV